MKTVAVTCVAPEGINNSRLVTHDLYTNMTNILQIEQLTQLYTTSSQVYVTLYSCMQAPTNSRSKCVVDMWRTRGTELKRQLARKIQDPLPPP